jgi:hypothetical protein
MLKLKIYTCLTLAVILSGCKDEKLESQYKQLEYDYNQIEEKYKQLETECERIKSEKSEVEVARNHLLSQLEKIKYEEQERKKKISPLQRQQLVKLLDSGARVNAAVTDGVNLQSLRELHASFNGDVALVTSNWPRSFPDSTKIKLQEAAQCWSFAQAVWADKIQYEDTFDGFFVSDTPIPGPIKHLVKTSIYTGSGGKKLEQGPWEALRIGLTVGSQRFESAQGELLNQLNE